VHKRVVGNAGTGLYGRMDMDELATPGYSVLSPATKSKLATLSKGELMVRHPHFTQPIFVRFPRPAALTGRQGVQRFAPEADLPLEEAVVRQLRRLDRRIPVTEVKDLIAGRDAAAVLTALQRTPRGQPGDVLAVFRSGLQKKVPRQAVPAGGAPHRGVPVVDDPYA